MKRAVFLDRDGTIIEEKLYLHRPEEVAIFSDAPGALKRLQTAGFLLVIITNQSGVGRGYFRLEDVKRVHEHLLQKLRERGVDFAKVYIAPEAPDQPSHGRKPSPQFLFEARDELGLDLSQCYMIGDKLVDLECGWNGGVKKSILVRTGYGAEVVNKSPDKLKRALVVNNLASAADWILRPSESSQRAAVGQPDPTRL
ncbi:MAG: HAD family hydrolase [Verrucomicrobia bacterium]|nr:HAD family hydrolase [Verrucomicrobiota bacterium]